MIQAAVERRPLDGRTVLAVFAHPDDESLACGGTLARIADAGARVILLCASHGERGSSTGPARDDDLGRTRAREMREAAALLGIRVLMLFDHPDGDLRWARVSELHAQIVMTIRRYAPAAVITFDEDGLYWHPDHIGIHERTTAAVRSLGNEAPTLYYVTMPAGAMRPIVEAAAARGWTAPPKGFWSLAPGAFGLAAPPPTMVVDVRAWVPRKLAAVRCHQSQMDTADPLTHIGETDARVWLGTEQFRRAPLDVGGESLIERLACT